MNTKLFAISTITQFESLWTTMYRDYITTPINMRRLSRTLKEAHTFQRELGLEPMTDVSHTPISHITKLISNVFGIEISRKLSPLVHMVGHIMRGSYPLLDSATRKFLDSHKKVTFVAFGQHAVASDQDIHMIMQIVTIDGARSH